MVSRACRAMRGRPVERHAARDVHDRATGTGQPDAAEPHDLGGVEPPHVPVHTSRHAAAAGAVPADVDPVEGDVPHGEAPQHRGRLVADDPSRGEVRQRRADEERVPGLGGVGAVDRPRPVAAPANDVELTGAAHPAQVGIGPPAGEEVGAELQVHAPDPQSTGGVTPHPRGTCGQPLLDGDTTRRAHLPACRARRAVRGRTGGAGQAPRSRRRAAWTFSRSSVCQNGGRLARRKPP
jgi:hypothetical protein